MNETLGIIIVNYNSAELLKKCIDSIVASFTYNMNVTTIVVDNNSKDESCEFLSNSYKRVELIALKENIGFGKACNLAFKKLKTDYILFLNPDVILNRTTLVDTYHFYKQLDKDIILGCTHVNEFGEIQSSCSYTPKLLTITNDILGLSKLFPTHFKSSTLMPKELLNKSMYVDQVMGAFMFMKSSIFDTLNGFDERFFVYYEDADFAFRAKKKGILSYLCNTISVYHKGRGTTERISEIALFYNLRSRLQFVKKHYGDLSYLYVRILTICVEPVTRFIFNPNSFKKNIVTFKKLLFSNV